MTLPIAPTITAFERSPDRGRGLARDMRVRWALEEVGQAYEVRLVSFAAMKEPAHRALHPFGQIPTYEEGDLALFESGAIVFHVAERHAERACYRTMRMPGRVPSPGCLPRSAQSSNRSLISNRPGSWRPIKAGTRSAWRSSRIASVCGWANFPLALAIPIGWMVRSGAGDLMMVAVLFRLKASGLLDEFPNLAAYVARGEARPAYKRAFEAQLAVFTGTPPTG